MVAAVPGERLLRRHGRAAHPAGTHDEGRVEVPVLAEHRLHQRRSALRSADCAGVGGETNAQSGEP